MNSKMNINHQRAPVVLETANWILVLGSETAGGGRDYPLLVSVVHFLCNTLCWLKAVEVLKKSDLDEKKKVFFQSNDSIEKVPLI